MNPTDITHEIPIQTGLIALLDSLGTRGITVDRAYQRVISDWRRVVEEFELSASREVSSGNCTSCQVLAFSDTILVSMVGTPNADLVQSMTSVLYEPFFNALLRGVFLRGTVAAGRFIQERTKILGPAIDEAAAWYEQANWIGVTAAPSFDLLLQQIEIQEPDQRLSFPVYPIPEKQPVPLRTARVLAWPTMAVKQHADAKSLLLQALHTFGGVITPAVVEKYTNTIVFFDSCLRDGTK